MSKAPIQIQLADYLQTRFPHWQVQVILRTKKIEICLPDPKSPDNFRVFVELTVGPLPGSDQLFYDTYVECGTHDYSKMDLYHQLADTLLSNLRGAMKEFKTT